MAAQWIWAGDAPLENAWVRFRKRFTAAAGTIRVAVDSKYWLWLNGRLIVREGGPKRGPTPRDTYADLVELPVGAGENTLAILAWYWGGETGSHNDSGRGGLYVDGAVGTDASWRASLHPAFGPSERPLFNGKLVLPEFPVNFDARQDEPDWTQPAFDDTGWAPAVEAGCPPCQPWGGLVDRPIPPWRDSEIRPYESVENHVGRLPANLQVYPWFRIDAPAGETVTIKIERDWKTSTYTTRAGVQAFEVPAWGNGHHVAYTVPPSVKVLDLGYRETGYDADFAGRFECDDEALNTLWRKSARTTYVCMRDTYMDCPDRERQAWPNDAVPMMEQAFYAFDRRSDPLFAKMIREFVGWRSDDGILWGPVPNGRFKGSHRELVGVTLQMLCGWWTYHRHSGDLETVRDAYPHFRDYLLKHWQIDPVELVRHRGPDRVDWGSGTQNWYDWGDHQDWRLMDNGLLAMALRDAGALADLVGDKGGAAALAERHRTIRDGFDRVFWRGDHWASPAYAGEPDPRGHAMAFHGGLIEPAKWPALANVLRNRDHASITAERFVASALLAVAGADEAIARLKRRFAAEIASPYSTLPEAWGGTANHGWSGWPLTLLASAVAGIEPLEPGYRRVRITPRPGPLRRIHCGVATAAGRVDLQLRRDGDDWQMEIHTPSPTVLRLPAGYTIKSLNGADQAPAASLDLSAGTWQLRGMAT